jgi:hypothetical protein
LKYKVTLTPQSPREFLGALVLALFFVANDEVTWREDGAGRITIENAGKKLMQLDPESREIYILSLFKRRFVPVDPERAEKVLTMVNFFLRRRPAPGDSVALDFSLKNKTYRVEANVASEGEFKLPTVAAHPIPCARVNGKISGWGGGKQTTVEAYVGREGDLAGKIIKTSFKFTDWPKVTLTLAAVGGD